MESNETRVRRGRRRLFGSLDKLGFEVEWHDYRLRAGESVSWLGEARGSHVEICLNLEGDADVEGPDGMRRCYEVQSWGLHCRAGGGCRGTRGADQPHRYYLIRFSQGYLRDQLRGDDKTLHPLIREIVVSRRSPHVEGIGEVVPFDTRQLQMVRDLGRPPVLAAAQRLWYQSKVWEWMAECFYVPPRDQEPLCFQQKRVARERVDKVIRILRAHLDQTPRLEELGRQVGCSSYYLSRTFSKEMGMTIPQYLRKLRMEEAGRLLRSGRHNVTEAALAVGYSSISHFSHAFCQTMGCCPTLYPYQVDRG